jgi:hypothetical protein
MPITKNRAPTTVANECDLTFLGDLRTFLLLSEEPLFENNNFAELD